MLATSGVSALSENEPLSWDEAPRTEHWRFGHTASRWSVAISSHTDIADQVRNLVEFEAILREVMASETRPYKLARYYELLREVQAHLRDVSF